MKHENPFEGQHIILVLFLIGTCWFPTVVKWQKLKPKEHKNKAFHVL